MLDAIEALGLGLSYWCMLRLPRVQWRTEGW